MCINNTELKIKGEDYLILFFAPFSIIWLTWYDGVQITQVYQYDWIVVQRKG